LFLFVKSGGYWSLLVYNGQTMRSHINTWAEYTTNLCDCNPKAETMNEKRRSDDEYRAVLGKKFRVLRELFNFSRPAYAEELGMSVGIMRTIEAGTTTCNSIVIQRITKHPKLGPYVLWLMDDSTQNIDTPMMNDSMTTPIFKDLLITIVEAIEETAKKNKCDLPPEKKGELIYILYCQAVKAGKPDAIDWDSIHLLIEFTLKK